MSICRAGRPCWAARPCTSTLMILVPLALAQWAWPSASALAAAHYEVTIQGVEDEKLLAALEKTSHTLRLKDTPPRTVPLLRRRALRDVPRMVRVLRAYGCYGAGVEVDVEPEGEAALVRFLVSDAKPYLFAKLDIAVVAVEDEARVPDPSPLGMKTGSAARAEAVLDYIDKALHSLKKAGHPFPRVSQQEFIVDHATRAMDVFLRLDPGPKARFGKVQVEGTEKVSEVFVANRAAWREGELFHPEMLTKTQKNLMDTGLFSMVEVKIGDALDAEGMIPVSISVSERKHRSFILGVSYKTDVGLGGKVSWEHRNLWGGGERLSLSAMESEVGYALEGSLRRPDFLRRDQSLVLLAKAGEDSPDPYTSRSAGASVWVEKDLRQGLVLSGGLGFRAASIEQLDEERHYALFSSPFHMSWDSADDPMDPSRGGRLTLKATPYYDLLDGGLFFVKALGSYSRYFRLSEEPFLVLAGRAAAGFIAGGSHLRLPADERLYAGGGGSVRGYPFQTLGPLERNEPLGGKSLLEMSLELRARVTRQIGVATFVDGGMAYASALPEPQDGFSWAWGAGVRYHTPVGPLRLDVAFPLNRRPGIDDYFQVYVSLGQAF